MALDQCHEQVVRALQNDGWVVDPTPYRLYSKDRNVYIDTYADHRVNGTRHRALLVEIKCFPDRKNTTRDIYIGIGQYIIYRTMIKAENIQAALYLAVPEEVYEDENIFDETVIEAIKDTHIRLVIVNLEMERVIRWIE